MYLLAVASDAPLGEIVSLSSPADPGIALVREAERRASGRASPPADRLAGLDQVEAQR
jgi:hypothetical protein